jgi:hypothetical protein
MSIESVLQLVVVNLELDGIARALCGVDIVTRAEVHIR